LRWSDVAQVGDRGGPKVFNMIVENSVGKRQSVDLSGSCTEALALCTTVRAGTLVVAKIAGIAAGKLQFSAAPCGGSFLLTRKAGCSGDPALRLKNGCAAG